MAEAGIEPDGGRGLQVRDPWGNVVEIVDYREIQFTKTPGVLAGMGLVGLEKTEDARRELAEKGLACQASRPTAGVSPTLTTTALSSLRSSSTSWTSLTSSSDLASKASISLRWLELQLRLTTLPSLVVQKSFLGVDLAGAVVEARVAVVVAAEHLGGRVRALLDAGVAAEQRVADVGVRVLDVDGLHHAVVEREVDAPAVHAPREVEVGDRALVGREAGDQLPDLVAGQLLRRLVLLEPRLLEQVVDLLAARALVEGQRRVALQARLEARTSAG